MPRIARGRILCAAFYPVFLPADIIGISPGELIDGGLAAARQEPQLMASFEGSKSNARGETLFAERRLVVFVYGFSSGMIILLFKFSRLSILPFQFFHSTLHRRN